MSANVTWSDSTCADWIMKKQFRLWVWGDHPVERITEHYRTIITPNVRYFFVKMEMRKYSEPIDLKLLNALWEVRSHFLDADGWHDRLYNDKGETIFSVWHDQYWQTVYHSQGKRYPRPRKCKNKARMSKKWRAYE